METIPNSKSSQFRSSLQIFFNLDYENISVPTGKKINNFVKMKTQNIKMRRIGLVRMRK